MCVRPLCPRLGVLILSVSLAPPAAVDVCGQQKEVLRLYGSTGPSPAIEEAAMVFATHHDVKVEVTSGPRHIWREKARINADLMFSSADFMMSDYVRAMDIKLDEISTLIQRAIEGYEDAVDVAEVGTPPMSSGSTFSVRRTSRPVRRARARRSRSRADRSRGRAEETSALMMDDG